MDFIEYADMSAEQREVQIRALEATFVGIPGLTGAPLVMGPGYYRELAIHQLECGVRVVATAIKTYAPPTDLRGAGDWTYVDQDGTPEGAKERIQRMAREEHEAYMAELKRRRGALRAGTEKPEPKPSRRRR